MSKLLLQAACLQMYQNCYLLHFGELPASVLVVSQVLLIAHQDNGNVGAEVFHLRSPLLRDVL